MEIEIVKENGKEKPETINLEVISYNKIVENSSILVVKEGELGLDDNATDNADFIRIFKLMFIASCKAKNFPNEILVAFYMTEESVLCGYVMSDLPNGYFGIGGVYLVDYKSYAEICELTGEKKLSFKEYYAEIKSGNQGINTLLTYENKTYNHTEQVDFLKEYDEKKKKELVTT